MRRVFTLGETVLDILFRSGAPVNSVAGGSMLNTAVALGRMGCQVEFISEFGQDAPGKIIENSLEKNHVSSKHSIRYDDRFNTSVALAFLDESQNASYTFYHHQPDELTRTTVPETGPGDILAFGSFYSVKPARRRHVAKIVRSANESGAFIIFDPNIRKNHLADLPSIREVFIENMSLSHLVKGSCEDFAFLTGADNPADIYDSLKSYCPYIIITQGEKEVLLFTPRFRKSYPVEIISPISTIGAGDNFTSGLIYGLLQFEQPESSAGNLTLPQWDKLIAYGIAFSAATCLSLENYIPEGFRINLKMQ